MSKDRKPCVNGIHYMTTNNGNKPDEKVTPPVPSPGTNGEVPPTPPVEGAPAEPTDIDFEKELQDLEKNTPPAPEDPDKELKKATFSFKSTAKRIKDLGGDPSTLLDDGAAPSPAPVASDDKPITQRDLTLRDARAEASNLAKSPGEVKLIMWYVEKKGLSVKDAHFLANKGKIAKASSEIDRANAATPSNGATAAGQKPPEVKTPKMNEAQENRLKLAGMVYDPATSSYTGKRTRVIHNGTTWVHERLVNGKWQRIPNANEFDS